MKLTVIIPVYNCESFLDENFRSLAGLYDADLDFEIIYVNDGSTDNSLATLNNIADNNECVKVINQENQGSSGARNTAIEIAQGEYIQFLDADDTIEIGNIIKYLSTATQQELDLYGYWMDFVDEKGVKITDKKYDAFQYDQLYTGKELLVAGYQPSSICVFLFKRQLLIKENLRIVPKITHMDVEFMSRVMLQANRVFFSSEVGYHYTQRSGSITKPQTREKLENFLFDEVIVAGLIKDSISDKLDARVHEAIIKNYNSVVWNLLYRLWTRKEMSQAFILQCKKALESKNLYPINGPIKTRYQYLTRIVMNRRIFWFWLQKRCVT